MEQAEASVPLEQGDTSRFWAFRWRSDLFCTTGVRTTAGSKIRDAVRAAYDADLASPANLLRDGAVFLGKTNMGRVRHGFVQHDSHYGPVENPWKRRQDATAVLVPGGSSGGSAAAVAARLAMGATGTDTGGWSIGSRRRFAGWSE